MMSLKKILFVFVISTIYSCNSDSKSIPESEIIEKSIVSISRDLRLTDSCYVVSPFLNNYYATEVELDSFFKKNKLENKFKSTLLKEDFINFSNCKSSYLVFSFSEVIDSKIVVNFAVLNESIKRDELFKKTKKKLQFFGLLLFNIDENNKLTELDNLIFNFN